MAASVRLQRYLATAGVAARRKAEDLITAGRVTVNGEVVRVLGTKVDPEHDQVQVDGEAVVALDSFYVLFNKPKGCITAVTDDRGRPTVMDYLPNLPVPVKPVGRLDFYTEGVLLLTNDGELAARLLAPANHVPKTYHAKVHGRLSPEDIKALRRGVQLDDGTTTMPADVELLPGESKHTWLAITIHEGKHRQIHRMVEALGFYVDKLQRVAFANLDFHDLRIGDARELTQQELNELRDLVGLDRSAVARGTWRAIREDTDIARRARAKARAEEEAEAAPAGEPDDRAFDEDAEGEHDDRDHRAYFESEAEEPARSGGRSAGDAMGDRGGGPRPRGRGGERAPAPRSEPRDRGGAPRPRGRGDDPRGRGGERSTGPRRDWRPGAAGDRDRRPGATGDRGRGSAPRGARGPDRGTYRAGFDARGRGGERSTGPRRDWRPGPAGDRDRRPGAAGDRDRRPGAAGDRDRRPGAAGDRDRRPGAAGDHDRRPGAAGERGRGFAPRGGRGPDRGAYKTGVGPRGRGGERSTGPRDWRPGAAGDRDRRPGAAGERGRGSPPRGSRGPDRRPDRGPSGFGPRRGRGIEGRERTGYTGGERRGRGTERTGYAGGSERRGPAGPPKRGGGPPRRGPGGPRGNARPSKPRSNRGPTRR